MAEVLAPATPPEATVPAVEEITLEQWAAEHRIHVAHARHLAHANNLALDSKAAPSRFAALLESTMKAGI